MTVTPARVESATMPMMLVAAVILKNVDGQ